MSFSFLRTRADLWRRLREALSAPSLDDEALAEALAAARARMPPPVVWLIGKAQAGKTSIIHALTGSPRAEIGNGFQPCTRSSLVYAFPADAPVVRFLDTRGLGEVDYDPGEDIALAEGQAHLLLAVIKAADPEQRPVLEVLRAVRRRHPDWPLIIAQSGLHELYPPDLGHREPYPFADAHWPADLPPDLVRALHAQRAGLADLPGDGPIHWVALDLTLPEDGWEPTDYGLEALWSALSAGSSAGIAARLGADPGLRDLYRHQADATIVGHALAAAGLGALPLVDLMAVPALQARLLRQLGGLYGQSWDRRSIGEFLGLLGAGIGVAYGARTAGRGLVKLVPVWGQTLGAVWGASSAGATTFALGKAAAYWFANRRRGIDTDAEALRREFSEAFARGTRLVRLAADNRGPHR